MKNLLLCIAILLYSSTCFSQTEYAMMKVHLGEDSLLFNVEEIDSVTFGHDSENKLSIIRKDTIVNTIEVYDTLNLTSRINNANGFGNLHLTIPHLSAEEIYTNTEFPQNIKRGLMLSCHFEFDSELPFSYVEFGKGKGYRAGYLKITKDSLFYVKNKNGENEDVVAAKFKHNLQLSKFLNIILTDNDGIFSCSIMSYSGIYNCSFTSSGENNGDLFFSVGQESKNIIISVTCNRFKKPIWMFGDSYFGTNTSRIIGCLENLGYCNCYVNAIAGQSSTRAFSELTKSLKFGTPSLLLWCLGMNDDIKNYKKYIDEVYSLSKNKGIEVAFMLVPTTETKDKTEHRKYLKDLGVRCIDAYSAVGSNPSWYEGFLDTDKTHPTSKGAYSIACQFLIDIPELLNWGMKK